MKKKFTWLVIAVMTVIAIPFLTSCGSDDEPSGSDELVGTWKSNGGLTQELNMVQYMQFNQDGTYYEVNLDEGEVDEIIHARWTRNGNKLKVSGGNVSMSIEAEITKLTKNELVIKTLWEQSYKKVSDSEINKYLD